MKLMFYKQEMGDTERPLCPGAQQGPAEFQPYANEIKLNSKLK